MPSVPDSQVAEYSWKEIHGHGGLKLLRVARVHGTEWATGKVERSLRVTLMEVWKEGEKTIDAYVALITINIEEFGKLTYWHPMSEPLTPQLSDSTVLECIERDDVWNTADSLDTTSPKRVRYYGSLVETCWNILVQIIKLLKITVKGVS